MKAEYESAIDIVYQKDRINPFLFRIPGQRLSQNFVNLCLACQMLKKLSLIEITVARQFTQLYKQCLTLVIQSPLLPIRHKDVVQRIIFHLQYWEHSLGKHSSWPHTRTCFYYLQDKLKKVKQLQLLDYVRLKRGMLQPNKKQFLAQMSSQSIQTQTLKQYITLISEEKNNSHSKKMEIQQKHQQLFRIKDILYEDSQRSWQQLKQYIHKVMECQESQEKNDKITEIQDLLVTYQYQVLAIYVRNQIKKINNLCLQMQQTKNLKLKLNQKLKAKEMQQLIGRIQFRKWVYQSVAKIKSVQFQKAVIMSKRQLKKHR